MLSIIVVDSDEHARNHTINVLNELTEITNVKAYADPSAALQALSEEIPDAIVMETEMTNVWGIQFAKEVKARHSELGVIFLSNNKHYATEAFSINVIDYILKPLTKERMNKVVKRILS